MKNKPNVFFFSFWISFLYIIQGKASGNSLTWRTEELRNRTWTEKVEERQQEEASQSVCQHEHTLINTEVKTRPHSVAQHTKLPPFIQKQTSSIKSSSCKLLCGIKNYNLCPFFFFFFFKPNGHFEVAALFKIIAKDDTQRKANWNKKKARRPNT